MKILIVDDNQDNRMTIQLLLEEFEDLEIFEAEDGQEAIELCKEKHFDLIFMDIMMPNVDGIKATRIIKSFDKKTMVLALSALDDEASKNEMLASGAEDYMTKPIESELFHQRVKNYIQIVELRKKRLSNTNAVNHFTQEVYSRTLKFNITSLQSLAEMWDYYLNKAANELEGLEDCIRMIYAYGQLSIKSGHDFTITEEENDDNVFLTLSRLEIISDLAIQHTLVKNYSNAVFILDNHELSFRLLKAKPIMQEEMQKLDVNEYQQDILSKTHFNKTPASVYVEQTAISLMDKIENLESIEESLEKAAIAFEQNANNERLTEITGFFDSYITVIDNLLEFEHFAYALNTLNEFFKALDTSTLEAKEHKKLSMLLLHLLDDIAEWRKNIFILQEANDIHYLDSSLLSSCLQIQSIFEKKDVAQNDEDDFELF